MVVKIVDKDVSEKVDTRYIAQRFTEIENVSIIYTCTLEGGEDDDWLDDEGTRHIIIDLPYKEVKKVADIKPLMLAKVKEKLGLVA